MGANAAWRLTGFVLRYVVINDDLEFCLWKCYGRGALNRFLVILTLTETRAMLIMKVSSGVIFLCAGFSPFAYVGFFLSGYKHAKCLILGAGVEDNMNFIACTVIL